MTDTQQQNEIRSLLSRIIDPTSNRDIVTLGMLRAIETADGVVTIRLQAPASAATAFIESVKHTAEDAARSLRGVKDVRVEVTQGPLQPPPAASAGTTPLPGVRNVVAVGAGKGGVGKSTVALLLAVGLTRMGRKVALLDADVYGPSIPKLTGTEGAEPEADEQGRIILPERDGIRIMSMGYLVPPDQAVIWRGPMAQKYVKEFLDRGRWEEIDYMIVDLPPGTGDIPLTLAQSIPLTGAVVVCTPQDVALLDAVKALRMYEKLGVEPLGIVENMSYYLCPHCGHRDEIFSHGGAEKAAAELNVPFLGSIPLNVSIRISGDEGRPLANFTTADPQLIAALEQIVARLDETVEQRAGSTRPHLSIRD